MKAKSVVANSVLFSTQQHTYISTARHTGALNAIKYNSMARLVEVDVLEDGLGRELLELAVGVGLQVPG